MFFTELPPEILSHILSFLNGVAITKLSLTCKLMYQMSECDILWKQRCLHEYKFTCLEGWNLSFKEVYAKVLHKYGFLHGLWKIRTDCYGGLVQVQYTDGSIVGHEYFGQQDINKELIKATLFTVSVEPSSGISLEWHRRMYKTTTPCTINAEGCTPYERFSLVWHRNLNDESDEVDERAKQRFAAECRLRGVQWLIHFTGDKFQNVNIQTQQFERLYLPAPLTVLDPLCPLREGLFKGMYSAHGTEIMLVTINWEKKDVSVLKISGDSNVPAGEVSVEADLSRPMLLTREQQITIEQVAAIDRDAPLPVIGDALTSFRQPFVIPTHESADMEAPDMCLCRYHALGTVSPTGYVDPQRIPVHFVVFDADTFGVIWIDLYHFSFYRRVHEELGASGVS